MNAAQLRTNPISPDSGTYSPNGTRCILSYLALIPCPVRRNALFKKAPPGAAQEDGRRRLRPDDRRGRRARGLAGQLLVAVHDLGLVARIPLERLLDRG